MFMNLWTTIYLTSLSVMVIFFKYCVAEAARTVCADKKNVALNRSFVICRFTFFPFISVILSLQKVAHHNRSNTLI